MTRMNALTLAAAGLCIALTAAACGTTSRSPGVASAGGSTTTAASPPSSSGGGSRNGGGARGAFTLSGAEGMAKFASCMRKNGVPNFPDPSSGGTIAITPSSGINPTSPAFQKAQKACRKYAPSGGKAPSPAEQAKMQAQALKFSACMRAHGVTKFPDPQFSSGRTSLRIGGTGIDPNSPVFKAAQKACAKNLPGAPTTQSSGR
jgi:hypothetical protein